MSSVKLNKKHLFSILVILVLLFSLNLNVFASDLISFYDYDFNAYYQTDSGAVNCTSTTTKARSSAVADNGRLFTVYVFTLGGLNDRSLMTGADLNLYTNTEYEFDFQFYVSGSECPTDIYITLWVNSQNNESAVIVLCDLSNLSSREWVNVSGSFKTPDFYGNVEYCMIVQLRENVNSSGTSGMTFMLSDMACYPVGPLYGEPITPADTSGLTAIMGDYDNTINQLPSIKDYDTDSLFDVNLDSYTSAMNFVKDMFDNFMALSGLNSVLLFALCIGLATYIIGRKVG